MSTHENPRRHGQVPEPDPMTSERLLDGREQEHPLARIVAAASAPASPREIRRESEAVHAFASREVLDARTATGGLATERILDRMRSRRDALASALRPVPLAKGLLATTVAVAAAFAVGTAVTGPADPVDSTSPAALALDDTATTTTADDTATTTTTAGTATTTTRSPRPHLPPPSACGRWWKWGHHHHESWPTAWPTDWPTAWPSGTPTTTLTPSPSVSPEPQTTSSPSGTVTKSPWAKPDRKDWKACYGWWKKHHPKKGFQFEGRTDKGDQSSDEPKTEDGTKSGYGDSGSGSGEEPGSSGGSDRDDTGGSEGGSTS